MDRWRRTQRNTGLFCAAWLKFWGFWSHRPFQSCGQLGSWETRGLCLVELRKKCGGVFSYGSTGRECHERALKHSCDILKSPRVFNGSAPVRIKDSHQPRASKTKNAEKSMQEKMFPILSSILTSPCSCGRSVGGSNTLSHQDGCVYTLTLSITQGCVWLLFMITG